MHGENKMSGTDPTNTGADVKYVNLRFTTDEVARILDHLGDGVETSTQVLDDLKENDASTSEDTEGIEEDLFELRRLIEVIQSAVAGAGQ
jgi:hypothetical protein